MYAQAREAALTGRSIGQMLQKVLWEAGAAARAAVIDAAGSSEMTGDERLRCAKAALELLDHAAHLSGHLGYVPTMWSLSQAASGWKAKVAHFESQGGNPDPFCPVQDVLDGLVDGYATAAEMA